MCAGLTWSVLIPTGPPRQRLSCLPFLRLTLCLLSCCNLVFTANQIWIPHRATLTPVKPVSLPQADLSYLLQAEPGSLLCPETGACWDLQAGWEQF